MKQKNAFKNLPQADQQTIIELCNKHSYAEAVQILRKPRSDGGLDLITSTAALCRFYTNHHQTARGTMLGAQLGHVLQIRREQAPGACLTGILALVETRLLESLSNGHPLADLSSEFRLLKTIHALYLADEKFRRDNIDFDSTYKDYIDDQACEPDVDFIRAGLKEDPAAPGITEHHFDGNSDEETFIKIYKFRKQAKASQANTDPGKGSQHPENSTTTNPKSPVIPPIPPISTGSFNPDPVGGKPAFHLPKTSSFINQLANLELPTPTSIPPTPSPQSQKQKGAA